MSEDVLVWCSGRMQDGVCKLLAPVDVPNSYQLDKGISRLRGWKVAAHANMNPDFPKDIALADGLGGSGFVVVSGRVRQALEGEGISGIEYLPLRIINHKGRVASNDHFIVNPLVIVDCIDDAASRVEMNTIIPTDISSCERLVLRQGSVPAAAKVFRPERWRRLILIERGVAQRLQAAGLVGLLLVEPAAYKGLF